MNVNASNLRQPYVSPCFFNVGADLSVDTSVDMAVNGLEQPLTLPSTVLSTVNSMKLQGKHAQA